MMVDPRPHIVIATTAFDPFVGGAEIAVAEIIARTNNQFRYTVVTARLRSDLPRFEQRDGYVIVRVGSGNSFDKIRLIFSFAKIAKHIQADLVWAIMASYAGAAALIARKLYKIPYALTLQEGDDLARVEKRIGIFMPFFKQIFIRAEGIQTIATFLKEWARNMGATQEIRVISNGVDAEKFFISPEDRAQFRAAIRQQHSISEDARVVLTVSRLVIKNGISDLIAAVSMLEKDVHLIIVGSGELQDELKQQSEKIRDRVHFVGTKKQDELKQYAAAADVFCRPALSEGQGIVFLEAIVMGLPVVATNVGGIPEMLTDGKDALLVNPNDVAGIARALSQVLSDNAFSSQLEAAAKDVLPAYSWDKLALQVGEWLSSCIKND